MGMARVNVLQNLLRHKVKWLVPEEACGIVHGALLIQARNLWRIGKREMAKTLLADPAVFSYHSRRRSARCVG